MKFACPNCSQHLEGEEALAGHEITCPGCSQVFAVPRTTGELKPSAVPALATPSTGSRWTRTAVLSVLSVLLLGLGVFILKRSSATKDSSIPSAIFGSSSVPIERLDVFPSPIQLHTQSDLQSVVVQALQTDGVTLDVSAVAEFKVVNPVLAAVSNSTLKPLADGKTQLQVRYGGKEILVPLEITNATEERPVSFRLDVMPVLMKSGCNSGGCHGASRGKDGFHLSLFGYDPDGDYEKLTREWVGRRVNLAIPEESLLLEKGLAKVPHGGGQRFTTNSPGYLTLLKWIEAGAPKDATNVASVVRIEMLPKQAVLSGKDARQRLTVRAHYSDNTDRDVTSLAVFFTSNEIAVKVGDDGLATAGQRGEAFVMARFDSFTVGSQMIVVPPGPLPDFPKISEDHYIDQRVNAKLRKLRMNPSELCDDATFIRRVFLDITGTLPMPEQVTEFVDDRTPGKRDRLVDELLQRKEFADLWVMKFAELLQIRSVQDQFSYKSALQYYDWLRQQLLANVPINRVVQNLLTGRGSSFQNPAASYYQVQTDTLKLAENTAQVFMGMRIQCAQCHNHPFDRWTMDDYYGFAAFFARVGRKPGEDPRESILFDRPDGEVKHPVGGRVMVPKFLGGQAPVIEGQETRREILAAWMASPENPYFARNLANIVWAHFMGRGIIEPVDDVRVSNPASNPELLEALGARFTEYQYDFRKLVRDICTSHTYQRSTRANESNALDDRNFARAGIRRLRAEVLLDIITQVTETKNKFQGLPRGSKAVEIPDGNVNNYFLRTFGRATRSTVCSCEVRTEPNLSQALHLLNGTTVQEKIEQGGVIKRALKAGQTRESIITDLYLRCLARKPTTEELAELGAFFAKDGSDPATVLTDVFWALLNAKEFAFNH